MTQVKSIGSAMAMLLIFAFAAIVSRGDGDPASAPTGVPSPLPDYVVSPIMPPPQPPLAMRIVSAAPNITEICCALGLRDSLVGRTRYCEYPPGIEKVRSIGALLDMNNEALLELRADLILVAGESVAQSDKLRGLGLRFESLPDRSLEDLFATIRKIGALANREQAAERLGAALRADLETVRQRHSGKPKLRVLLTLGPLADPPAPPYVAGPGSFYDELLSLGNQTNAAPSASAFGQLSLEFIARNEPDVIVELVATPQERPGGDADALAAWAKVGQLRAVREHHVHTLVGHRHYVLGPRVALTADELLTLIDGKQP